MLLVLLVLVNNIQSKLSLCYTYEHKHLVFPVMRLCKNLEMEHTGIFLPPETWIFCGVWGFRRRQIVQFSVSRD